MVDSDLDEADLMDLGDADQLPNLNFDDMIDPAATTLTAHQKIEGQAWLHNISKVHTLLVTLHDCMS